MLAQNTCAARLGNFNPQLYVLAAAGSDALVDVSVRGQNCPSTAGYRRARPAETAGYLRGTGNARAERQYRGTSACDAWPDPFGQVARVPAFDGRSGAAPGTLAKE